MIILIVEDNPVNAKLMALLLGSAGYQSKIAGNGKEALALLSDTPDIQLIITDYMMPEMDGLELVQSIRAVPHLARTPVLIASAHADLDTVKRARRARCDGFLIKPIDKQQLLKRVGELLDARPRVLTEKRITVDNLALSPDAYDELIKAFAGQIEVILGAASYEQDDPDEPISEHLGRLFAELAESASTLGAMQFLQHYSTCCKCGKLMRNHCRTLVQSLMELDAAIKAQTIHPVASGKEAAA
jgi:CheY-like chemotaxis protein